MSSAAHDDGGDAAAPQHLTVAAKGAPGTPNPKVLPSPNTQSPARPAGASSSSSAAPASTQHQLSVRFRRLLEDVNQLAWNNRDESMCDYFSALAEEAIKSFRGTKSDIRVAHRAPAFHRTSTSSTAAAIGGSFTSLSGSGKATAQHVDPQPKETCTASTATAHRGHPSSHASHGTHDDSCAPDAAAAAHSRTSTPPAPKKTTLSYAAALNKNKGSGSAATTAAVDQKSPQKAMPVPPAAAATAVAAASTSSVPATTASTTSSLFGSAEPVPAPLPTLGDNNSNNNNNNKEDPQAALRGEQERQADAEERRKAMASNRSRKFEEQAERTAAVNRRREQNLEKERIETLEKAERHERERAAALSRKKDQHESGAAATVPPTASSGGNTSAPQHAAAAAATTAAAAAAGATCGVSDAATTVSDEHVQPAAASASLPPAAAAATAAKRRAEELEAKHQASLKKLEESAVRRKEIQEEKTRSREEKKHQVIEAQLASAAENFSPSKEEADFTHRLAHAVARHGKMFLETYAKEHGAAAAAAAAAATSSSMTATTTGNKKKSAGAAPAVAPAGGATKTAAGSAPTSGDAVSDAALHAMSTKCRFYSLLEKVRAAAAANSSAPLCAPAESGADKPVPKHLVSASNTAVVLTRAMASELSRALASDTAAASAPAGNVTSAAAAAAAAGSCTGKNSSEEADHNALRLSSPNIFEVLVNTISQQATAATALSDLDRKTPFDLLHRLLQHPREGEKHRIFFCRSGIFVPVATSIFQVHRLVGGAASSSASSPSASTSKAASASEAQTLPLLSTVLRDSLSIVHCCAHYFITTPDPQQVNMTFRKVVQDLIKLAEPERFIILMCDRLAALGAATTMGPQQLLQQRLLALETLSYAMLLLQLRLLRYSTKDTLAPDATKRILKALLDSINAVLLAPIPEAAVTSQTLFSAFRVLNEVVRRNLSLAHGILADIEFRQMTYQALNNYFSFAAAQQPKLEAIPCDPSKEKMKDSFCDKGACTESFMDAVGFGITFQQSDRPVHVSDVIVASLGGKDGSAAAKELTAASGPTRLRAALHESLLFAGYICLHNPAMQDLFHYQKSDATTPVSARSTGSASSDQAPQFLLALLVQACPVAYFSAARHILMPSLLCICQGNRRNMAVLQNELGLDSMCQFIVAEITARPNKLKKSSKAVCNSVAAAAAALADGSAPPSQMLAGGQPRRGSAPETGGGCAPTPRPRPESWADMLDDDSDEEDNSADGTCSNASAATPLTNNSFQASSMSNTTSPHNATAKSEDFMSLAQRKQKLTNEMLQTTNIPLAAWHHFRLDRRFPLAQWPQVAHELTEFSQLKSPTH